MMTDTSHRCIAGKHCRDAEHIDDPTTGRTLRQPAVTAHPERLCDPCIGAARHAVTDMHATWRQLNDALGEANRDAGARVSTSRAAPIPINTQADALKMSITEWLVVAATRLCEPLNIDQEPRPHNNTDLEHSRVITACTRIIEPHIDHLAALPAEHIVVWRTPAETQYPGERRYTDETGAVHHGIKITPMSGAELALQLTETRRKARAFLEDNSPADKLDLPCPRCTEYKLTRRHEHRNGKQIDEIDCGACGLSWPWEQYRNLTRIWVREDEMEREKLQKQLDTERSRRELAEWLLAKREWQINLALDCTDVSASAYAATILSDPNTPEADAYMSDRDIANLVGVSDSTIRSWASRGHISRHTTGDGSTVFAAQEVWDYAKTHAGGRIATVRRMNTERKIQDAAKP